MASTKTSSRTKHINTKNDLSETWPTVFELAAQIPQVDLARVGKHPGGGKNRPPVTQGLIPQPFPVKEGYHESVTPEQLASLRVPTIEVNGDIRGFQREKANAHARKIARAMLDGEEMPPIIVSIFPDGKAYVGEGQHRALGAIIARKSLEVIVKKRTVEQARKLFANQGKAKSIRSDDTILSGDSVLELYIQDAVTSDGHPWSDLVAPYKSDRKMTPTTMAIIVGAYTYNTFNQGVNFYISRDPMAFDERLANELADLIRVFGNKVTNPLAFRGRSLRAISYAATMIFRRNPAAQEGDFDRWRKHMATFDFSKYPHLLTKETEMAAALVDHWNKRLSDERKVKLNAYR